MKVEYSPTHVIITDDQHAMSFVFDWPTNTNYLSAVWIIPPGLARHSVAEELDRGMKLVYYFHGTLGSIRDDADDTGYPYGEYPGEYPYTLEFYPDRRGPILIQHSEMREGLLYPKHYECPKNWIVV